MAMTGLLQTIADGGCYWRRKEDSPGHSFAMPNGSPFKVAIEGMQSQRFREGICQDGYFVLNDGTRYLSANEAVGAVRDVSSNAFLYMHFRIDGRWMRADDIREKGWSAPDEVEEEALNIALPIVREKAAKMKSDADEARILRASAKFALQHEPIMSMAKEAIERRKKFADLVLDLKF